MKKHFLTAIAFLSSFALWTHLISVVDVQAIGPEESAVGFAVLNQFIHNLFGVHMSLYVLTDWLGLVPVAVGFGFAVLGLIQWIKRKNILKVDRSILVLGGFYILTLFFYLFFEEVVINYRPVLIGGYLEASYPSSTTLLVLCVMPTACMHFKTPWIKGLIYGFMAFMVIGRLVSGVHWFTDIIGGILLSAGLVYLYKACT